VGASLRLPAFTPEELDRTSADEDPIRLYRHPIWGGLYRRRVLQALELLGTGRDLLEIGYGSGTSLLESAARFDRVHGIDLHDYAALVARVCARGGARVRLSRASSLALPFRAGSFDAVLAVSVLEHLQPVEQPVVMGEIARVLRPGGRLVAGVPGLNRMMSAAFRVMGYDISPHHFSAPRDVLAAARAEFSIDAVRRLPPAGGDATLLYLWFRAISLLP
jgi:SAM-dependent methyltransferase